MNVCPARAFAASPPSPRKTLRDAATSGKQEHTTSARDATSASDAPSSAPAATSSSTGPRDRDSATTPNPARSRFSAIGFPIRPSPMNPIVAIAVPSWLD